MLNLIILRDAFWLQYDPQFASSCKKGTFTNIDIEVTDYRPKISKNIGNNVKPPTLWRRNNTATGKEDQRDRKRQKAPADGLQLCTRKAE